MSRPFGNHKRRGGKPPEIRSGPRWWSKVESLDYPSQWAYLSTLDGTADEFESNECWGNNASLLRGPFHVPLGTAAESGPLNRRERRFIRRQAGCVVHEDSQGFLAVDWHRSANTLEKHWERIEAHYNPADDDSDDDSESDD